MKTKLMKEIEYYEHRISQIGTPLNKHQRAALTRARNCLNVRLKQLKALEQNDFKNWPNYPATRD